MIEPSFDCVLRNVTSIAWDPPPAISKEQCMHSPTGAASATDLHDINYCKRRDYTYNFMGMPYNELVTITVQ